MSEWQDIATAPESPNALSNPRYVLVGHPEHDSRVAALHWVGWERIWVVGRDDDRDEYWPLNFWPTHWQPLPAPPSA